MAPKFSSRVERIRPSATVALTDKAKELKAQGRDIVSMSAGEPDFPTPPRIVEAAKRALDEGHTHYVASPGIIELRKAVVDKLRDDNAVELHGPDEVIVVPGAKAGLMFACLALLQKGDECVCPEPAWVSYRECVDFADGVYVPVATSGDDGFTVAPEALAAAITDRTRLVVLNSPTNPSGKVWSRTELEAVADIVRGRELVVLSDEIYEDLLYDGNRHVSFASLPGMADKTLTLNGLSKAYAMTGWRLGYLAGPRDYIKQILKIQQHSTTCATSFAQYAAVTALREGRPDVDAMVEIFRRRRRQLLDGLQGIPGIRPVAPQGTFYMFLDVADLGIPTFELAERLLQQEGLALTPGAAFGESGEGYMRLSFAASDDDIRRCCERLRRFADGLRKA